MAGWRSDGWCGNLRLKCFIIGYLNLIAGFVDIVSHFFVVAVVTRGFECEIDGDLVAAINWPWIQPILLIINLGTHGFFPFPLVLNSFSDPQVFNHNIIPAKPRCYPGMIHLYQLDVLHFLINVIWFKFVISYVNAVHKKNPEPMRMFFGLSVVKLVLQVLHVAYLPNMTQPIAVETYWSIKIFDILLASVFLYIINQYIKQLRNEKPSQIVDQPPSYIECLIMGPQKKKEEKPAIETIQPNERKNELPEVTIGRA